MPKNISRRGFLRGTAATAAGAAAISVLSSCKGSDTTDENDPIVVESGTATYVLGSGDIEGKYQEASEGTGTASLAEAGSWNLPLGCVLRPSEGS